MSWTRILRFAKQRQVPVIVTDESGEDPMILLSLDQLEQALDGNSAPDLPPPPPAPRSTTPSFVPEYRDPEPAEPQPEKEGEASSLRPEEEAIEVPSVAPAAVLDPLPPAAPTESEGPAAFFPPLFDPEPAPAVEVPEPPAVRAEPEIVVWSEPSEPSAPVPEPPVLAVPPPVEPVPPVPVPVPEPPPAPEPTPSVPAGLSLEERFFLDF